MGRKPVSKLQKRRNLEKKRRMSRIEPRNTMGTLNLVRIFGDSNNDIGVPASTDFTVRISLDNCQNSADISMNSENASIISTEQLKKLNKEYLFFPVTEDVKQNIYRRCQEA